MRSVCSISSSVTSLLVLIFVFTVSIPTQTNAFVLTRTTRTTHREDCKVQKKLTILHETEKPRGPPPRTRRGPKKGFFGKYMPDEDFKNIMKGASFGKTKRSDTAAKESEAKKKGREADEIFATAEKQVEEAGGMDSFFGKYMPDHDLENIMKGAPDAKRVKD